MCPTYVFTLLILITLAATLLAVRPNTIENLIPYETAITLPPTGILARLNPMPNSPYGPFPSNNPNALPY